MRASASDHASRSVAPRLWSCPRCGYVELVAEPHPDAYQEHATAGALNSPFVLEADEQAHAATSTSASVLEQSVTPVQATPAIEPSLPEDEPVAGAPLATAVWD